MFSSNSKNAKMTCGYRVHTDHPEWYKSMTTVLKKIKGASYTIDVEEGMAYVTGRVNPTKVLRKLKAGNHANMCWVSDSVLGDGLMQLQPFQHSRIRCLARSTLWKWSA